LLLLALKHNQRAGIHTKRLIQVIKKEQARLQVVAKMLMTLNLL
jgi:hypothetical protein